MIVVTFDDVGVARVDKGFCEIIVDDYRGRLRIASFHFLLAQLVEPVDRIGGRILSYGPALWQ